MTSARTRIAALTAAAGRSAAAHGSVVEAATAQGGRNCQARQVELRHTGSGGSRHQSRVGVTT